MGRRPDGHWNSKANVEAALRSLDDGTAHWPSYQRFMDAGLDSLRQKLVATKTVELWAARLGWQVSVRRSAPSRWTDEAIETALRQLIDRLGHWPSRRELREAGLHGLVTHLERTQTGDLWRRRLDARSAPAWRKWTEDRIATELATAIGHLGRWPTRREFRDLGLDGLQKRLRHDGSAATWAHRFGVELPVKFVWDDAGIELALKTLITSLDRWPTRRELTKAGLGGLAAALERSGTTEAWAERFGVTLRRGTSREGAAAHLLKVPAAAELDERVLRLSVETLLDEWVDRLGRWPSFSDFDRVGKAGLHDRLGRSGRRFWRKRLTEIGPDGSAEVRPPLGVGYDAGAAAAWRFARDHGHLVVPVGFRDCSNDVPLRRWIELVEARSSPKALETRQLVAAVREFCTDPHGTEPVPLVPTAAALPHTPGRTMRERSSSGNH